MASKSHLLAAKVPRYTSYPTAPHFHAGIGAHTFSRWLHELPAGMPLSLYVHIPFCDTLCWFCGCHTRVVNSYSPVQGYLGLLRAEVAAIADLVGRSHPVTHIHFGGGSPTMLSPADFRALVASIRSRYNVSPDAEIAVEIDPRGLSDEMIAAMAESGVNRASIGVQDYDPKVQAAINRIQPFSVTKQVVRRLREAGIDNLNLDLIYGLPHQSVALLEGTIARSVALDPDRLAIFGYAHVPHFKKHQKLIDATALPGLDARLDQFEAAHTLLAELGYVPIGLDHFAKPGDPLARAAESGTLARNFQGYTTDTAPALIGMGASAISALPQGYAQNVVDVPAWRNAVAAGDLAVAKGVELSQDDRLRRAIIERLMCDLKVELHQICAEFDVPVEAFAPELQSLAALAADGIVKVDGYRVSVPDGARAAVRVVCAIFDSYLSPTEGRHALAV